MRKIPSLGESEARAAVEAVSHALKAENLAAVIGVADQQGEPIALLRLDGAPYPSIVIALNKAWTAARERRGSHEVGTAARAPSGGFDMASYGDPRYTGFGGGIPVVVDGVVVGAVAVSGLSTEDDIRFARIGLEAIVDARVEH